MEILKIQNFVVKIARYEPILKQNIILKRYYAPHKAKRPDPPRQRSSLLKGGVILCGCGHLDGTCMLEATAVAVTMSRNGIVPEFYAPSCFQADVVNHNTLCPAKENRCAQDESARIARGPVQLLSELRYCDLSCIVIPGGFGVAKTLSTFEEDRSNCSIDAEVMRVLEEFHDARKPMGFVCIAGILPARLFPYVKVTLGMKGRKEEWPYQYAIDCACAMGAEIEQREVDSFSFDKQHMVFTTPGFMYNGTQAEVFDGVSNMVHNLCKYIE